MMIAHESGGLQKTESGKFGKNKIQDEIEKGGRQQRGVMKKTEVEHVFIDVREVIIMR